MMGSIDANHKKEKKLWTIKRATNPRIFNTIAICKNENNSIVLRTRNVCCLFWHSVCSLAFFYPQRAHVHIKNNWISHQPYRETWPMREFSCFIGYRIESVLANVHCSLFTVHCSHIYIMCVCVYIYIFVANFKHQIHKIRWATLHWVAFLYLFSLSKNQTENDILIMFDCGKNKRPPDRMYIHKMALPLQSHCQ